MNESLEQLYQEAKSALKVKDYVRAGDLLRQILLIDENYKDASRLLARVVREKRQRWYNRPALWIVVGLAVLVGLGVILVTQLQGSLPRQVPQPTEQPTVIQLLPGTAVVSPT